MRVQRRGKFNTLVLRDGSAVEAALYGCTVVKEPHESGGKTYATLDVQPARGAGVAVLTNVEARIRKEASPEFSPLRPDGTLVVKFSRGVRYETRDGLADAPFVPSRGQRVDVVLQLGAFGQFGYCWLVRRIKPHDPADA